MKKPIVFYFVIAILFLSMNGGAYLFLFAPCLEQYVKQQDDIDAKKRQKKSITSNQEEIHKYRMIEKSYLENNAFYEKWVRKNFSSTEIKVYLHELGKKVGLKIEPEDKTEVPEDPSLLPPTTDVVVHAFATYEINAFFTPEQLKNYLYSVVDNQEKLFLLRTLEAAAVSTDALTSNNIEVSDKDKYMKVRMILDYVYFLPAEEEKKE